MTRRQRAVLVLRVADDLSEAQVADLLGGRISDAPDDDLDLEDGETTCVTPEAEERFTRLHVETMVALQSVLATGEFRPGRYRREAPRSIGWQRDESSP